MHAVRHTHVPTAPGLAAAQRGSHLAAAGAPVPLKVGQQLEAAALLAEADRLPLHHQAGQLQMVGADFIALQAAGGAGGGGGDEGACATAAGQPGALRCRSTQRQQQQRHAPCSSHGACAGSARSPALGTRRPFWVALRAQGVGGGAMQDQLWSVDGTKDWEVLAPVHCLGVQSRGRQRSDRSTTGEGELLSLHRGGHAAGGQALVVVRGRTSEEGPPSPSPAVQQHRSEGTGMECRREGRGEEPSSQQRHAGPIPRHLTCTWAQ